MLPMPAPVHHLVTRALAPALLTLSLVSPAAAQQAPKGPWNAFAAGAFGPVVNWPLIPIHAVLLPDGRVMSYGTDGTGKQTGQFEYAVWDPGLGTGANAHLVLPNTTPTDIFCNAQVLLPGAGSLLLAGGDRTVDGKRNYSVDDVNFFDYASTTLYASPNRMAFLRWYPSLLTLDNGEVLVLGGRASFNESVPTPEIYSAATGWRTLPGASSEEAYGLQNWSYPRAWQAPNGGVFVLTSWGGTYRVDPAGLGSVTRTPLTVSEAHYYLPAVMYAPGKILALRKNNRAITVDITGMTPSSKSTRGIGQDRYHANATVLPDGTVFVSGGSMVDNAAWGVAYAGKIWDPESGAWTTTASARKMRLYHSVSLLLPDATVLTAGGGAPGPQANLNAEIYYPPYLYKKDFWSWGQPAPRPSIISAPDYLAWDQDFEVRSTSTISRITLVRTGSATHTLDFDQRFIELPVAGPGTARTTRAPAHARIAPPGFYMLFVFDTAGVPSVARIVRVGA